MWWKNIKITIVVVIIAIVRIVTDAFDFLCNPLMHFEVIFSHIKNIKLDLSILHPSAWGLIGANM